MIDQPIMAIIAMTKYCCSAHVDVSLTSDQSPAVFNIASMYVIIIMNGKIGKELAT